MLTVEAMLVVACLLLIALITRGGEEGRRASASELASARAVVAARLRSYEIEREERFRHYHAAWRTRRPQASKPTSGYVLPFRAVGGAR